MPLRSLILLLILVLGACTAPSAPPPAPSPTPAPLTVGMLLARGGRGDLSFNDSAYQGLEAAQRAYGIQFEVAEFDEEDPEANAAALRDFAQRGHDLIIGIGFENAPTVERVAAEFPMRRFAIIDVEVPGENVRSVTYREQEGDFLMGVLAAMVARGDTVGFIGGMDIPIIRRIQSGFEQGVAHEDPTMTVLVDLAGSFTDPTIGHDLALAQYEAGADLIYHAAGRTGLGVVDAALEADRLVMGTSTYRERLAPANNVGNRAKRVDTAILRLVDEVQADRWQPGTLSLGLKEDGLSLGSFDSYLVTDEMRARLDELAAQIIAGEIVVE